MKTSTYQKSLATANALTYKYNLRSDQYIIKNKNKYHNAILIYYIIFNLFLLVLIKLS